MSRSRRTRKTEGLWRKRGLGMLVAIMATASALGTVVAVSYAASSASSRLLSLEWRLEDAPWLSQPKGSPSIDRAEPQPSLRLPAGVDYGEGLRQLYVAAAERGQLPPGTVLEPPLPDEVVLVLPSEASEGLRLSLTAPWGWSLDERRIRPPSVHLPGDLSPQEVSRRIEEARAEGAALPEGGAVDVPVLSACQVAVGDPSSRPPCLDPKDGAPAAVTASDAQPRGAPPKPRRGTATLLSSEGSALLGSSTNCSVNASGGYANCLYYSGPGYEVAKAHHGAGLPYRLQLHRPADGARWGYWQWSDLNYHTVSLNLAGTVVAQIDNRGSANPASYYVEMG